MTVDEFRSIALSLPESEERSHMDHPDFRVGGKIFATISPDGLSGMAKLKPEQQEILLRTEGKAFRPASGAWGRGGATMIDLELGDEKVIKSALTAAWKNIAPKTLLAQYDI
jgi:hypothetical protein